MRVANILFPIAALATSALALPEAQAVPSSLLSKIPDSVQSVIENPGPALSSALAYVSNNPSAVSKVESLIQQESSLLPAGVLTTAESILHQLTDGQAGITVGGTTLGGNGGGNSPGSAANLRAKFYGGSDGPIFACLVGFAALMLGGGVML